MWFSAWYGTPTGSSATSSTWQNAFPLIHDNVAFHPFKMFENTPANRVFLALYYTTTGVATMIYEDEKYFVAPASYRTNAVPLDSHHIVAAFWGNRATGWVTVTSNARTYYNSATAEYVLFLPLAFSPPSFHILFFFWLLTLIPQCHPNGFHNGNN